MVGFDLDARSRELAVELGVVDRCADTLAEACRDADVIQLATPILALERLLGELAKLDRLRRDHRCRQREGQCGALRA